MKARPILFSGEMVRALLAGRKTQTRRIITPQPPVSAFEVVGFFAPKTPAHAKATEGCYYWKYDSQEPPVPGIYFLTRCHYGCPGDLLYVRETILQERRGQLPPSGEYETWWADNGCVIEYVADGNSKPRELNPGVYNSPWLMQRPAIHMPRWASRLTLRITDVRVERLNAISEADAIAEGRSLTPGDPRGYFPDTWEAINGKGSWAENPWVWALKFEVIKANVDAVLEKAAA